MGKAVFRGLSEAKTRTFFLAHTTSTICSVTQAGMTGARLAEDQQPPQTLAAAHHAFAPLAATYQNVESFSHTMGRGNHAARLPPRGQGKGPP